MASATADRVTRAQVDRVTPARAHSEGASRNGTPAPFPRLPRLVHTGVNAAGKTVKSPVDGALVVLGSGLPATLVATHHTTSGANALGRKWLSVKPGQEGDLPKTIAWAAAIRQQVPEAKVTLALTTNAIPSDKVVTDLSIQASASGIAIDLWDLSRLAHELDRSPDGQWLRSKHLGVTQERLDRHLLHELSVRSLATFPIFEKPDLFVHRSLDSVLDGTLEGARDVTFLIAESGLGKSIACRALLERHIGGGGCGLVIPHQFLEEALSLDVALDKVLRQLHPSLEADAGAVARRLCRDQPLLLVVEDVNKALQPTFLVERLIGWSGRAVEEGKGAASAGWRLICPVWPQVRAQLAETSSESARSASLYGGRFTAEEATAAILRRARAREVILSSLQASELATAVECDPLLIGLFEPTAAGAGVDLGGDDRRLYREAPGAPCPQFGRALSDARTSASDADFGTRDVRSTAARAAVVGNHGLACRCR